MNAGSSIRNLFAARSPRPVRRASSRWRLALEALEGRTLLSTIVVNNPTDTPVTGETDLRQAIVQANSTAGASTIDFAPTVFGSARTITLASGQLELSNTTGTETITGPAAGVTVSGGGLSRVFQVDANVTASISGLTITDGNASEGGGVFNNGGNVSFVSCTFSNNTALGSAGSPGGYTVEIINGVQYLAPFAGGNGGNGEGGGLYSGSGSVTITDTTFSADTARGGKGGVGADSAFVADSGPEIAPATNGGNGGAGQGGGLYCSSGSLTITNTTFSGDSAQGGTGGKGGTATGPTESNSSGSAINAIGGNGGNGGNGEGGGLYCSVGSLTIAADTTVSSNSAGGGSGGPGGIATFPDTPGLDGIGGAGQGGGLYGQATLNNTIVAGNTNPSGASDISGDVSGGYNLIGTGSGGLTNGVDGNIVGTAAANLGLAPLANNGGPTQTMALVDGSPAIGAGSTALIPAGVTTDQRGPGYPRILSGLVDIGAFEFKPVKTMTSVALTTGTNPSKYGTALTFTATVTSTSGVPTGSVEFYDGSTPLGAGNTLTGSGNSATSTFTISTLSVSGSPHAINAEYTATVSFANSNSTNLSQTITAAALTVTPNAVSTTYSGVALNNTTYSDNTANYAITGFQNGQTITSAGVTLSGSLAFNGSTSTSVENVGTYTQAVGTLALSSTNKNYSLTFSNPTPNKYVISAAALTITPNAVSTSYSDVALNNTTYSDNTGHYSIAGFQNGQTITTAGVSLSGSMAFNGSTSTSVKNAGTYTQAVGTLALSSTNKNYSLSFSNPMPNDYVITAAALTVTPKAVSTTYSSVALNNTTYSDATGNYAITGFQNGQTITSAGVSLSGSMAFNGSTSTSVENVGTYTQAVGTLALSSTNSNYSMTFSNPTPNNYVITAAALTVTPKAVSTTYSGVALNNTTYSDTTGNYAITGFLDSQTITSAGVTLSGSMAFNGSTSTSVENVGTYTQTVGTLALSSTNYSMTFSNPQQNKYVIRAAALTVTPNAVSTTYNGVALNNTTYSDNTGNYAITGFQNGETIATAGVTLSGSMAFNGWTFTSVENAGTYTQTAGSLALSSTNKNYSMTFSNPTANNYVITAAALTVTPNAVSTTFSDVALINMIYSDGTGHYSITGFQNGQTIATAGVTLTGSMAFNGSTSTSVKDVGTYTQAVGTLTLNSTNYSMTFSNPTPNNYVITAAALTVTPKAVSTRLSGVALDNTTYSDNTDNYLITGFKNGQTITSAGVTLSGSMAFNGSTSTTVEAVGTYTQEVGTLALSSTDSNYSMTFSNPTPNNYVITAALPVAPSVVLTTSGVVGSTVTTQDLSIPSAPAAIPSLSSSSTGLMALDLALDDLSRTAAGTAGQKKGE